MPSLNIHISDEVLAYLTYFRKKLNRCEEDLVQSLIEEAMYDAMRRGEYQNASASQPELKLKESRKPKLKAIKTRG